MSTGGVPTTEAREPATHDYTSGKRTWGHDCVFRPRNGGLEASMTGWGPKAGGRIWEGDVLLLSNPTAPSGLAPYRVREVRYLGDPPDMWHAEVEFAPGEGA